MEGNWWRETVQAAGSIVDLENTLQYFGLDSWLALAKVDGILSLGKESDEEWVKSQSMEYQGTQILSGI